MGTTNKTSTKERNKTVNENEDILEMVQGDVDDKVRDKTVRIGPAAVAVVDRLRKDIEIEKDDDDGKVLKRLENYSEAATRLLALYPRMIEEITQLRAELHGDSDDTGARLAG